MRCQHRYYRGLGCHRRLWSRRWRWRRRRAPRSRSIRKTMMTRRRACPNRCRRRRHWERCWCISLRLNLPYRRRRSGRQYRLWLKYSLCLPSLSEFPSLLRNPLLCIDPLRFVYPRREILISLLKLHSRYKGHLIQELYEFLLEFLLFGFRGHSFRQMALDGVLYLRATLESALHSPLLRV